MCDGVYSVLKDKSKPNRFAMPPVPRQLPEGWHPEIPPRWQASVPSAFTPDYAPEEMMEILKKLTDAGDQGGGSL
jgi:hypothetical protein